MAPTGLVSRLKGLLYEKEPDVPQISTTTAVAALVLYTLIYVVPFYLSPTTRPSEGISRDAPAVIKGRIRCVTVSTTLCAVLTFVALSSVDGGSPLKSLHRMGLFPVGFDEVAKVLALTAILFMGPLFEAGIAEGGWRDWIRLRGLNQTISGWIGYRNFIAGPITEELLFRSCSVPLLLLAHTSNTTTIFLTPIIFGMAHLHHFYEFRIHNESVPLIAAILRSLLQFTYTTLFGGFATFVFLRTGSVLACTVTHTFCNWMGFPRFWGRVTRGNYVSVAGGDMGKRDENREGSGAATGVAEGELGVGWTVTYYILLVGGAWGFYKLLWVLTESESALTTFS